MIIGLISFVFSLVVLYILLKLMYFVVCDKTKIQIDYEIMKYSHGFICYVTRVKIFGFKLVSLLYDNNKDIVYTDSKEEMEEYIEEITAKNNDSK